jgi:hypothetical protein
MYSLSLHHLVPLANYHASTMATGPSLSRFDLDNFLSVQQHLPEVSNGLMFSPTSIPSSHFSYQSRRRLQSSSRDHDWEVVHGHLIPNDTSTRRACRFMDLSEDIRHRIYELILDLETPRRVFINYDHEWRRLHLTQGEKIQHSAAITKVELKKPPPRPKRRDGKEEEEEHRRLSFTLREFSKDARRHMSRSLWPSILRVSKEARFVGSKIYYECATFTAPSDPWTIPEWEARLPIEALRHLSQNRSLVMEHVCCEVQQWRCLRNYLYSPFRQSYKVIDTKRLEDLWGPNEVNLRRQLSSIPWRFTQLYTIDEEYNYDGIHYPNSKLDIESALHEVLHSEFLAEVQRIYRCRDQTVMEAQLYQLAYGMRNFFDKIVNLEEFEGFVEFAGWLQNWLSDPLGPLPGPLYEKRYAGGLFFGMHLWERDVMVFAKDMQKNSKNGGR